MINPRKASIIDYNIEELYLSEEFKDECKKNEITSLKMLLKIKAGELLSRGFTIHHLLELTDLLETEGKEQLLAY